MRTVLALTLLAATALPACLKCGFDGAGNTMYQRGNDSVMVCANGGFVVMLDDGTFSEGRTQLLDDGSLQGVVGETGALAFSRFTVAEDGTFGAPELGTGWMPLELDAYALDHTGTLCSDLETRAWWLTEVAANAD